MVKFIHTSDWQIGMKGGGLGSAGDLVRSTRIKSISNVFDIAKKENVDFVLICGDIFEHNQVSNDDVGSVISIFNEYPEIPVYLLPGNHDCLGPGCVYERDIFKHIEHLTVLTSDDPIELEGVTIHPLPIFSVQSSDEPRDNFQDVKDLPGIHIGAAHGSLLGVLYTGGDLDYPIDPKVLEESGLDYLALGHWHSYKIYEDTQGIGRIAYSGTHEQSKYDEDAAGYCLLVEINEKGSTPRITPFTSGELRWSNIEFVIRDKQSLEELEDVLNAHREADFIRLEISGELDLQFSGDFENVLSYGRTLFKDLRMKQDSLRYFAQVDLDSLQDFGDPTLNQVDRELRVRLQSENDIRQQAVLVKALSLLNRLALEV